MVAGVALALSVAHVASAQPTGNPKGSTAPSAQGNSDKPSASRSTPTGSGAGRIGPEHGPADARTQRTEPPGGGTAGGLTQRKLPENAPASKSRTDKGSAGPRPVSPDPR